MKHSEKGDETEMYIGRRFLDGQAVEGRELEEKPIRSEKIEEIFRRVRRRVEG